jgi:hypothetical protein
MDVAVIVDDIDRAQQTDNRHAQPLSPRGVRSTEYVTPVGGLFSPTGSVDG